MSEYIKFPKELMTSTYQEMSLSAKMLYALMLDRASLSAKNGWSYEGKTYICFAVAEVQELFGVGERAAIGYLKELIKFNLISKKKRGLGIPDIIFVHSLNEVQKTAAPDLQKNAVPDLQKNAVLDLQKNAGPINQTDINQTEYSHVSSSSLYSSEIHGDTNQTEKDDEEEDIVSVKNNIDYDNLLLTSTKAAVVTDIIFEAVKKENLKPQMLELEKEDVMYVLDTLERIDVNTKANPKAYVLTCLANAKVNRSLKAKVQSVQNVKTSNQVVRQRNSFNSFPQRTGYDFAALERKLCAR